MTTENHAVDLDLLDDALCMTSDCFGEHHDVSQVSVYRGAARAYLDLMRNGGWMPIETSKPFDGLVAYVSFADGFYGLATYKDFKHESGGKKERIQFWSLSDFHDYETYKYYGNVEHPTMCCAIPQPLPKPPAPNKEE